MKKQSLLVILIPFIFCYSFSQSEPENINLRSSTGARYVSGEDGLRMYVNVWGHVRSPGRILIVSSSASEGKLLNIDKVTSHFSFLSRNNNLVLLKYFHQSTV